MQLWTKQDIQGRLPTIFYSMIDQTTNQLTEKVINKSVDNKKKKKKNVVRLKPDNKKKIFKHSLLLMAEQRVLRFLT